MQMPLYTILDRRSDAGAELFDVRLNPQHAVFSGHFPEKPVLPGVCTMQLVRSCAEAVAGCPLRYAWIAECKFLAAILPDQNPLLRVSLTLTAGDEGWQLVATVEAEEKVMSKIKATLVA